VRIQRFAVHPRSGHSVRLKSGDREGGLQQHVAEKGPQTRRRPIFVVEVFAVVGVFEFRGDHPATTDGEPLGGPGGRGPVGRDDEREIGVRRGSEGHEQNGDEKRSDEVHA
jgi:hypothetical protein